MLHVASHLLLSTYFQDVVRQEFSAEGEVDPDWRYRVNNGAGLRQFVTPLPLGFTTYDGSVVSGSTDVNSTSVCTNHLYFGETQSSGYPIVLSPIMEASTLEGDKPSAVPTQGPYRAHIDEVPMQRYPTQPMNPNASQPSPNFQRARQPTKRGNLHTPKPGSAYDGHQPRLTPFEVAYKSSSGQRTRPPPKELRDDAMPRRNDTFT
ncbi:hypothetical protein SODALDRAFT_355306 [Sodiomyces alkalinus F11]|uniref:Uncharacterized protein n=1 Tax=Sodiomyces alkalinus (strain CBS 110278 / VKM F-3762 / F11) TaxID=1314773 RepID=A0A3N2Q8K8_SODAK|nr:hypothetical protein SODALDRAFT_355306 [Sodiomyces alkalinus F11]ROT43111.1 hypothetical protein SODALDRAFT_355306 [Sodiomyces alkalinus F11]